jgi:hypothetical protein
LQHGGRRGHSGGSGCYVIGSTSQRVLLVGRLFAPLLSAYLTSHFSYYPTKHQLSLLQYISTLIPESYDQSPHSWPFSSFRDLQSPCQRYPRRAFFFRKCTFFCFASPCVTYPTVTRTVRPPRHRHESCLDFECGVLRDQFLHAAVIRLQSLHKKATPLFPRPRWPILKGAWSFSRRAMALSRSFAPSVSTHHMQDTWLVAKLPLSICTPLRLSTRGRPA